MSNLVERLRARRMLANSGGVIGYGRSNARLAWITNEPDQDCAEAADEIERLQAENTGLMLALENSLGRVIYEAPPGMMMVDGDDRLRKDAERYRWLKRNPQWLGWDSDFRPDEVEREIDTAMEEKEPR